MIIIILYHWLKFVVCDILVCDIDLRRWCHVPVQLLIFYCMGYHGTVHSEKHSVTHITIFIVVLSSHTVSDCCGWNVKLSFWCLLLGFPQRCWLRCRVGLLCSEEGSSWPWAIRYHWMHGWLARGPQWIVVAATGAVAGLSAAGRMLGWVVVCPVHKASWPDSRASFLPSCYTLYWCVVNSYSFLNDDLLIRMASFYSGPLLSSLVCHWLVEELWAWSKRAVLQVPLRCSGRLVMGNQRQR